jgi:ethanolamine-phosphate cytidylyltransferase
MHTSLNPAPGEWRVEPQVDIEVSRTRIWIDGCFDFSHHGTHLIVMFSINW